MTCVFDRLRTAGLKLKPKKCHFAKQQITYLGHVISINGIEPDDNKLAPSLLILLCATVKKLNSSLDSPTSIITLFLTMQRMLNPCIAS